MMSGAKRPSARSPVCRSVRPSVRLLVHSSAPITLEHALDRWTDERFPALIISTPRLSSEFV